MSSRKADKSDGQPLFSIDDFKKENFNICALVNRVTSRVANSLPTVSQTLMSAGIENIQNSPFTPLLSNRQFHPDPFLFAFDDAIEVMEVLQSDSEDRLVKCAAETRRLEQQQTSQLAKLHSAMETAFGALRKLDRRVERISHTSVTAGHALESAAQGQLQAKYGQQVLRHIVGFLRDPNHGEQLAVGKLRDGSNLRSLQKAVETARLLQVVSHCVHELAAKHNSNATRAAAETGLPDGEGRDRSLSMSLSRSLTLPSQQGSATGLRATVDVARELSVASGALASDEEGGPLEEEEDGRDEHATLVRGAVTRVSRVSQEVQHALDRVFLSAVKAGDHARAYKVAYVLCSFPDYNFRSLMEDALVPLRQRLSHDRDFSNSKGFAGWLQKLSQCVAQLFTAQAELLPLVCPRPIPVLAELSEVALEQLVLPAIDAALEDPWLVGAKDARYGKSLAQAQEEAMVMLVHVLKVLHSVGCQAMARRPPKPQFQLEGGGPASFEAWLEGTLVAMGALGVAQEESGAGARQGRYIEELALPADADMDTVLNADLVAEAMALRDRALALCGARTAQWMDVEVECIEQACRTLSEWMAQSRLERTPEVRGFLSRKPKRERMPPEEHKAWLQDLFFSTDEIDPLFKTAATAVRRTSLFTRAARRPEVVETLLEPLLRFIYRDFCASLFTEALELMRNSAAGEADAFILTLVKGVVALDTRTARFFVKYVYPQVASHPNARVSLENKLKAAQRPLEELCQQALQGFVSSCQAFMTKQLSQRSSYGYTPKDGNLLTETSQCPHLQRVCALVESVGAAAVSSLAGLNIDTFLLVFGWEVYKAFLAHLKTCSGVSPLGAGLLVQHVIALQEAVARLHVPRIDTLFAELRILVNIFFVDKDAIKSFLTENASVANTDADVIETLLRARSDFSMCKYDIMAQFTEAILLRSNMGDSIRE